MLLNSSEIIHEGTLPSKFTCDGDNTTPPFKIAFVPQAAQSLVYMVEDPDAPLGLWTHLMIWDISADITEIEEGKLPEGVVGKNSSEQVGWDNICPPDENEHRYFFKIFALDVEKLEVDPATATRDEVCHAMEDHTVAHAELIGKYKKAGTEESEQKPK